MVFSTVGYYKVAKKLKEVRLVVVKAANISAQKQRQEN